MTDERLGGGLLPALRKLPKGSGVIFRHYSMAKKERRALFGLVRRIAKARRLMLLLAGNAQQARAWRADGWHGRSRGAGIHTAPVHSIRERIVAERSGAALILVSPIHATRSHPGKRGLGPTGLGRIARGSTTPIIALGGMNAKNARALVGFGIHGWAAIDALA
jgi:thiamine-phosphate pyrophosphorylase